MKHRKTPALDSLGPLSIWRDVSFLCLYRPDYYVKVARFLCELRREWFCLCEPGMLDAIRERAIKTARNSFIDTILPFQLKWSLRWAVQKEFGFDLWGPELDKNTPLRMRLYRSSPH